MSRRKEEILVKIANRELKLGIAGLGYVGLPLAVAFAQEGFEVAGIDLSAAKVALLNSGRSYVGDVTDTQIAALLEKGKLKASSDYADLGDAEAIIICVPTPLSKTKDPDISFIIDATDRLVGIGSKGKLIVLESTTYPGTTNEILLPRLISRGDTVGEDVFLAFSPERTDPGRTDYDIHTTPKVIGGVTQNCLELAIALYGTVVKTTVPVSNTETAEMVKLLENTFRAVNIGLVNELALMCDKLGLDVWEVIEAASTKPYGFMPFYPGPGLGGHCIPIDPQYLSWKLRTLNYTARFIDLAAEVNGHMPEYVVSKVASALNERCKALNGSHILLLGAAYKANVNDVRESPALDIMLLLQAQGAVVSYHDPFVPCLDFEGMPTKSIELSAAALQGADCVVVVTDHDTYDWAWIAGEAQQIVDTRNALAAIRGEHIYGL